MTLVAGQAGQYVTRESGPARSRSSRLTVISLNPSLTSEWRTTETLRVSGLDTKVLCPSVRRQPGHFDLYVLGVKITRLILFLLPAALAQATMVSISTISLPNGTVGQPTR